MTEHTHALQDAFAAVARWVDRYRDLIDPGRQFDGCTASEVEAIAHDLAITRGDLLTLTRKGPDSARLLSELLRALDIDPARLAEQDPLMMRDMQRLCVGCLVKRQCMHNLVAGTSADNYVDYCPNAYTIDVLLRELHKTAGTAARAH
jgi:hypothetical protein